MAQRPCGLWVFNVLLFLGLVGEAGEDQVKEIWFSYFVSNVREWRSERRVKKKAGWAKQWRKNDSHIQIVASFWLCLNSVFFCSRPAEQRLLANSKAWIFCKNVYDKLVSEFRISFIEPPEHPRFWYRTFQQIRKIEGRIIKNLALRCIFVYIPCVARPMGE